MKWLLIFIPGFLMLSGNGLSQTAHNPFIQNIHFEPEPSALGFTCGSVQTLAFTQGLTTSSDADLWQTQPLIVVICLTGFEVNGSPSFAVTGNYAANFDWSFDSILPNCMIGTQNQPLHGTGLNPIAPDPLSSGQLKVSLKVPETSPVNSILAVHVNLLVPSYMAQHNAQLDDYESVQTQSYCELVIKGTVFNDTDTVNQVNDINGVPISAPDGDQLFVSLVNSSGLVVASTPVGMGGTYAFPGVGGNEMYTVQLSIYQGALGGLAPIIDLPMLWVNVGEDCCDLVGNDGNPNGILSVDVSDFSRIHANFGIRKPPATGSLPNILSSFEVCGYSHGGLLTWTTTNNLNASHVDIYRKESTQLSFQKIATVNSTGSTSTQQFYSYLDKSMDPNLSYTYQLVFVSLNGSVTLSDIKDISKECMYPIHSASLYPIPATNELNMLYISDQEQSELDVILFDMAGRKVMRAFKQIRNGANLVTFDIDRIARGSYILHYLDRVTHSAGSVQFLKY
jgi:hypothetical protein